MEYEYATSQKVPVVAFIHGNPSEISHSKTEKERPEKLARFRERINRLHTRRTWLTKHDLATEVLASLSQTVVLRPRTGWVRGNVAQLNGELVVRLEEARQLYERIRDERDTLARQLSEAKESARGLAGDDDVILVPLIVHFEGKDGEESRRYKKEVTWSVIFDAIARHMIGWTSRDKLQQLILDSIAGDLQDDSSITESKGSVAFDDDFLTTIRSQLVATELITVDVAAKEQIWKLSEKGLRKLSLKRAIRRAETL